MLYCHLLECPYFISSVIISFSLICLCEYFLELEISILYVVGLKGRKKKFTSFGVLTVNSFLYEYSLRGEKKTHTDHEVVASSRFWVGLNQWVEVWRLADILKIVFRTKCQMMGALHHARVTCAADANEADSYKAIWGRMTTVLLKEPNISTYIFNTSHFAHALLCLAYIWATVDRHLCGPMQCWQISVYF